MAAPADKQVKAAGHPQSEVEVLRGQVNNLIDTQRALTAKLDVLTAKLNADAGVTDTNYATDFVSSLTDSTGTVPPCKVTLVG
jgi:multidrug efflux pump subunit AcrB